jgi:hypothetical protein
LNIEYNPVRQDKLISYFDMTANDGIYEHKTVKQYLYIIQHKNVFQWNHLTNILAAWEVSNPPNWISPNKEEFMRLPDDFKFSLTFSNSKGA